MQKYSNDYSLVTTENEHYSEGTKTKHTFSKFDYDLFDEEKNTVEKIIRVKKITTNKNEKWNIIENKKIIFVVDGAKISKKEREFLRTSDGFNFLIARGKIGIKSLLSLKKELKKILT